MKEFYQVSGSGIAVNHLRVSEPYMWNIYCLAFGVSTLDGLFSNTSDVVAVPIIQAAVNAMIANKSAWLSYMDPSMSAVNKNLWYNKYRYWLVDMRDFFALYGGGGYVTGAVPV